MILLIAGCQAQDALPVKPVSLPEPAKGPTSTSPTPTPSHTATLEMTPLISGTGVSYAIPAVERGAGFAPYEPAALTEVAASVPPYSTAIADTTNPQAADGLSAAQRQALEANGFVVVPGSAPQLYVIYQQAEESGTPIFVTTDLLLHTYHILYDFTLRDVEINYFVDDLSSLTAEMIALSQAQLAGSTEAAHEAARRNLAFFSVAAALLDPAFAPPPEVADLVAAELALIGAHTGLEESPIFGYKEDYSQYVPRGHYTRNETFGRYFRAMMWYGRINFRLRPGTEPEQIEAGRMETRQAILIATMLGNATVQGEPALAVWERIYEPTVFFVGQADDLTVYDYLTVAQSVYGETLTLTDLNDVARLDAFIAQGATLRPPRIVGGLVTDQEDPAVVTQALRFMGQRFVPDAYIFQQLVYDKVGTQDNPRTMPIGLDVPAALGSERAGEILRDTYQQDRYENYTAQLERIQAEFAALPPEQWHQNLYWGWLDTLQPLLLPPGEGYPAFMQSAAWVDKDLHTYSGSWAELKHDTILYAKQSYSMEATALQPTPTPILGYVEPRPELFARLGALVNQSRRGLEERGLLRDEFKFKYDQLETLLVALTEMANKELAGQPLTTEEQQQIRFIGNIIEQLTTFNQETEEELTSETDERLAIVADVHTDPNTGQVLEVAVGDAFVIWVIAPVDGQPTLTQGAVFSYYEFPQPMADRLTDEAWQSMTPKPEQPVWVEGFVVP
jgi:hypothetical protein